MALAEADFGEYKEARNDAQAALHAGRGIDAEEVAAEALAIAGDVEKSRELTEDLQKRYPLHVALINASLPAIEASAELQRGKPVEAVRLLEQSREWDLCEFSGLSPVYIRGLAYLRLHRGQAAAAEFQKILEHAGIAVTSNRHALAILGLARAYALSGEKDNSKKAYEDFFAAWANADPDLPIWREARAEYGLIESK